jgi:hypothetical protein
MHSLTHTSRAIPRLRLKIFFLKKQAKCLPTLVTKKCTRAMIVRMDRISFSSQVCVMVTHMCCGHAGSTILDPGSTRLKKKKLQLSVAALSKFEDQN